MKVLIVNNTESAFKAINHSINDSKIKFVISEKDEDVIDDIKIEKPQIVMINWSGEDIDAYELCKKIRRLKLSIYVYIIVISAREKTNDMSRLITAGADDFIFKPFGKGELALRVAIARKAIKREEALLKSKKKLMKLAKEDPITGLLNRRALLDEALNEMSRASRDKKYISSLMVTIENLNRIIDEDGHVKGNAVLLEFSNYLKKVCRGYDKLGRFNISQFLIFLPDTQVDQAEKLGNRILEGLQEGVTVQHEKVELDSVIGISQLAPKDIARHTGIDDILVNDVLLDSLIKQAESAVEEAKNSNNTMIIYR